METPKGTIDFGDDDEHNDFEPEPLTVERMEELFSHEEYMMEVARDGQFGFQIMMMHPDGHVQMAYDMMALVDFFLKMNTTDED